MKILALDTSTEACSAALLQNDSWCSRYAIAPRGHTELILPMCEEVLAECGCTLAQVDAVAFGRGPGAFTGVRVAVSVAQGIAAGRDLPVVPISSLAALAHGYARECNATHVLAAIDARMGELYWGGYEFIELGLMRLQIEECVTPASSAPLPAENKWCGAGTGWKTYGEELRARLGARLDGFDGERFPHAIDVALLGARAFAEGRAVAAEEALPVYLRDQVVRP